MFNRILSKIPDQYKVLAMAVHTGTISMSQAIEMLPRDESGKVAIGGILLLGIAFIMIGIAIKFAPMMITSFASAWTAANETAQFADSGLTDVLGFGPTLIILGFIVATAIVGFLGVKIVSKGE